MFRNHKFSPTANFAFLETKLQNQHINVSTHRSAAATTHRRSLPSRTCQRGAPTPATYSPALLSLSLSHTHTLGAAGSSVLVRSRAPPQLGCARSPGQTPFLSLSHSLSPPSSSSSSSKKNTGREPSVGE